MILVTYRHGLGAGELCELQWTDVEFDATLHIRRAKGRTIGTHPLLGDELRALRTRKGEAKSPFIFVSERGALFTVSGPAKLIERAGDAAVRIASTPNEGIGKARACGEHLDADLVGAGLGEGGLFRYF